MRRTRRDTRSSLAAELGRGVVAGAVATLAHTSVMALAAGRGRLGEPPPKTITRAALDEVAPEANDEGPTLELATVAMHFGFGAAMGALYAATHRHATLRTGLAFGSAVWAVSYLGWVPALGILPMPHRDRPGRPSAMLAAHWAFGAALASTLQRLRGAPR